VITRIWRGYAKPASADRYEQYLLDTVRPQLAQLAGFRGLYLLRRDAGGEVEFRVLTVWDSMAAIRRFAGPSPEQAVVEPAARAVLTRYDPTVEHYEVVAGPDLSWGPSPDRLSSS
jgi:heme-degrading monooxygenase HmoA